MMLATCGAVAWLMLCLSAAFACLRHCFYRNAAAIACCRAMSPAGLRYCYRGAAKRCCNFRIFMINE